MKDTLLGLLGVIAFIGAIAFFSQDINGNPDYVQPLYNSSETSSWEDDTSSDSPYIESDYVEDRGTDRCTDDCGGHSAGYDWAYENDVCNEDFDGGNSESFAEGVREYAYENC